MSNALNLNNKGKHFLLSLETRGIKLGLRRTKEFFAVCGNPENKLNSVQIIGTNGKGSTAATLCSILMAHGMRVGLYTSPHLVDLSERIRINNTPIENDYINHFTNLFHSDIQKLECTFFETLTAMAAHYFQEKNVDVAIFETGLGGQFDSVTACNARLQLFTKIAMDHSHILGDNIIKIAQDKACAIHKNSTCLSVKQETGVHDILNQKAKERCATMSFDLKKYHKQFDSPLIGEHQKENTMLAITASNIIANVIEDHIIHGIKRISWPGRIELIKKIPPIYFDVSHNDDSIIAFCNAMESLHHKSKKTLIISIQHTKQLRHSIRKLEKLFSKIVITQLNDRMYPPQDLSSMFTEHDNVEIINNPQNAISHTMEKLKSNEILGIIGSHYWGKYIYKNF